MPSLDKKYRPRSFKNFFGNHEVVESLEAHLKDIETFPSALLLHGQSGCGKTTLARILNKKLYTQILQMNIADTRGIEDARGVIDYLKYKTLTGKGKLVILNECHEATKNFWDALLEIMEEPPENVYFILCTTNSEKLPDPVMTRVTPFLVRPLDSTESKKLIKYICKKEKIHLTNTNARRIYIATEGVPRSILLILNSIKNIEDKEEIKTLIESFSPELLPEVVELCRLLLKNPTYKEVMKIASSIDQDPERIRRGIMAYMSKVLINGPNKSAAIVMDNCFDSWYWVGKPGLILAMYHIMKGG